jgi:hypothetical protein
MSLVEVVLGVILVILIYFIYYRNQEEEKENKETKNFSHSIYTLLNLTASKIYESSERDENDTLWVTLDALQQENLLDSVSIDDIYEQGITLMFKRGIFITIYENDIAVGVEHRKGNLVGRRCRVIERGEIRSKLPEWIREEPMFSENYPL